LGGYIGKITIFAAGSIGNIGVFAGPGYEGQISGTAIVAAGSGIGSIVAVSGVNATVTSYDSISTIDPGAGDLNGSITSIIGDLPNITANGGSIAAYLTAGGQIGNVVALHDISGNIVATGSIGDVVASLGNISGGITSVDDSVGNIYAGGNLSGTVEAKHNIGSVTVLGSVSGRILADQGSIGATNYGDNWWNYEIDSPGINVGGNISNSIGAASGDLNINVNGNITGNISGNNQILLMAIGNVSGEITGNSDITISGENISSNVTSLAGAINEHALANISGTLKAAMDIDLVATAINNADATGSDISFVADTVSSFYGNGQLETMYDAVDDPTLEGPPPPAPNHSQQVWDSFYELFGDTGKALVQAFNGGINFVDQPNDPKGYSYSGSPSGYSLDISNNATGDYLGGHLWWKQYKWVQ